MTQESLTRFSAGITINRALGSLQKQGQSIRITPVNMKVLWVLLAASGEVLSRQDIYQAVWGDQVVSDDALTRAISDLRQALKKLDASQDYIQTVPKKGYRWLHAMGAEPVRTESKGFIHILRAIGLVVLGLLLSTFALIAGLSHWQKQQHMKVMVMSSQPKQSLHLEVEQAIINSDRLDLVSSVLRTYHPDEPLPFFHHQYQTDWVLTISPGIKAAHWRMDWLNPQTGVVLHSQSINTAPLDQAAIQSSIDQFLLSL